MALTATPARRRIVMAALLLLAFAGGVVREMSPPGSTMHDVGTLLLVLWLPAVGNLIAWLIRRIPRKPQDVQLPAFPAEAAFVPHLFATLRPVAGTALNPQAASAPGCLLLVGGQAFTARVAQGVGSAIAATEPQAIELLRPEAARAKLVPGAAFHLLVGSTAVATGEVTDWSNTGR